MFGFIGKVFSAIKFIAPILPFIPGLQALAPLLKVAEAVTNIVDKFSKGLAFLDTVSKVAPMPKSFSQNKTGSFGMSNERANELQGKTGGSSKLGKFFQVITDIVQGFKQISTARSTQQFSQVGGGR